MAQEPGKLILINGASSSGKKTFAKALQAKLDQPFWHFSFDHIRNSGVLPLDRLRDDDFSWPEMRPGVFDGFHRCLPVLAGAGNNLIVEHIIETKEWMSDLVELLSGADVYFVAVHCPLDELERREQARGDRRAEEARRDYESIHGHCLYDMEIDGTAPTESSIRALIAAWNARTPPGAFEILRKDFR